MYLHAKCKPFYLLVSTCRACCRTSFAASFRNKIFSAAGEAATMKRLVQVVKQLQQQLQQVTVALQHLQVYLANLACDDKARGLATDLLLPVFCRRLDAAAAAAAEAGLLVTASSSKVR
jgi:hypothetical protein